MTHTIRYALVAIAACLVLSGCAGSQRTDATTDSTAQPDSRGVLVTDRSDKLNDVSTGYMLESQPAEGPRYNITLEEIRSHVRNKSAVFIDARSAKSFAYGHIRGAMNVPAGQVEFMARDIAQLLSFDQLIIIYCVNSTCAASDMVYEYLEAEGFNNMLIFSPGWQQLSKATDLHG